MNKERCHGCGKRVGWITFAINFLSLVVKFAGSWVSHSRSLFADSLESVINLVISIIVIISLKIADKEENETHPYGYGNIEFITSGAVYTLLFFAAIIFLSLSIHEIMTIGDEKPPKLIAVFVAALAIVLNFIAYGYSHCAGLQLKSSVLFANARASISDVATSGAVIIAVIAANIGWPIVDHLVGILIGFMILRMTLIGIKEAVKGMLDYSPLSESSKIRTLAQTVEGVESVKDIKTRLIGRNIWVDLEIIVSNNCRMQEGLNIIHNLKETIIRNMDNISEICVKLVPSS